MKKLFIIIAIFGILTPSLAFGAIAFDAATDGGTVNPGTSLTYSHTTTGSNRILFVTAFDDTGGSSLVTGVTYAGTALTKIGGVQTPSDRWVTLWYLIAPATGANDVVVSASASIVISSKASSYTGALQSGVPDASTTNTASSAGGITTTLTSIADNSWTVMGQRNNNGSAVTPNSGTTERVANGSGLYLFDSNGAITPAGSTSLGDTLAGSWNWGTVMASFAPFVVAAPASAPQMQVVWWDGTD